MTSLKKYFYLILLIIFLSTCTHMTEKSNISLVSLLPKESDVPGWEMVRRPVYLNKKRIMNNRLLKSKGILEYASSKFRSFANKNQVFKIDIMKVDNSINAFAIYSQKKGEGGIAEIINKNLFITKNALYGLKGEFYLSVESSIDENKRSDFLKFWEILDKNIIPSQKGLKFPEFLKIFINKSDYNDLIYYKKGHIDVPGARELFVLKKEKSTFFLKKKNDFDAMNLYNSMVKSKNRNFTVSKSDDIQLLLNKKNSKFIFISLYKNYIFGVLNAENILEGKKTIKEIYTNLMKNYKK